MNGVLQTERVVLRKFTPDDAPFIITLLNSPGWIQFIGDRGVKTTEDAVHYLLNGPLKSYELNGYGLYLVESKEHAASIGMCGLVKRENLECPDIGFAFLPEYMGKGLAYEAAKAMLSFARKELGLSLIYGITLPDNRTSIRLLEKVGMKFNKTFKQINKEEELWLYSNSD